MENSPRTTRRHVSIVAVTDVSTAIRIKADRYAAPHGRIARIEHIVATARYPSERVIPHPAVPLSDVVRRRASDDGHVSAHDALERLVVKSLDPCETLLADGRDVGAVTALVSLLLLVPVLADHDDSTLPEPRSQSSSPATYA